MEKRFVIRINGGLIEVTEAVYKAYYSSYRQERTQQERDARNRLVHFDAWDTEKGTGSEAIMSPGPTPEEIVIEDMAAAKLALCLERLSEEDREVIRALFYCGETVSSLSRKLGVPRKTLEGRRNKILRKLRIYFESPDR